jgi:uncharacterized protein
MPDSEREATAEDEPAYSSEPARIESCPADSKQIEPASRTAYALRCWRCGLVEAPTQGRCPRCFARLKTDSACSRPTNEPTATEPITVVIVAYILLLATSIIWSWVLLFSVGKMTIADLIAGTAIIEIVDAIVVLVAVAHVQGEMRAIPKSHFRVRAWFLALPTLLLLVCVSELFFGVLRDTLRIPIVQPAIIEELFFRYLAFGALWRATGLHGTVWVTAAMFAMLHIYNPLGLPYLFLAGIILGYARVWGGLALPMAMHFLHNLAMIAIEANP